ncbi:hypothetical protein KR032_002954, partial [Drosophila birchii]
RALFRSSIPGESVPRKIKNPGVSVRWIYHRLKGELLTFAAEFGFPSEGTVKELRRSFAALVRDSDQTQETRGSGTTIPSPDRESSTVPRGPRTANPGNRL